MDKKKNKARPINSKILCFFIAFILWFYVHISLNPNIEIKVYNIPVNIVNSLSLKKNGLIVLPDQKFSVNLTVKGKALDVYNLKVDNFEIILDLSMYELEKGENVLRSYVRSMPSNVLITHPNDLDITVLVDEFVEKRIYVDKNIEKVNSEGFYSFESVITPEYVLVSGASKFVNEINKAVVSSKFENLKQDTYQNLRVKFLDKDGKEINKFLDVYPDVVEMYIVVKAMKTVDVDIAFSNNLQDGLKLESVDIFPKQINIIGSEEEIADINKISSDSVDLSKITENSILEVPLVLNGVEVVEDKKSVIVKIKVNKVS